MDKDKDKAQIRAEIESFDKPVFDNIMDEALEKIAEFDRQQMDEALEKIAEFDRQQMDEALEKIAEFDRQQWELIQEYQKNSKPGSLPYFWYLWNRVMGHDEDDTVKALWELAWMYYRSYSIFPSSEERDYLEKRWYARRNEAMEEYLRGKPRGKYEAWHEDLTIPELEKILELIDHTPIFEMLKLSRKELRPAIRSDILDTERPYGTRDGKFLEDDKGRIIQALDPKSEEAMKAKARRYKYKYYPRAEKAFDDPTRDMLRNKLTMFGFGILGWQDKRMVYVWEEINKLTDHEKILILTHTGERGELEQYAQDCGKSVSALYKQRERLRKRILENVQKALNKPDIPLEGNNSPPQ